MDRWGSYHESWVRVEVQVRIMIYVTLDDIQYMHLFHLYIIGTFRATETGHRDAQKGVQITECQLYGGQLLFRYDNSSRE